MDEGSVDWICKEGRNYLGEAILTNPTHVMIGEINPRLHRYAVFKAPWNQIAMK